jgi:DNA-binding protein HU-beta
MTKADLIFNVSKEAGISKTEANTVIDSFATMIMRELKRGERVSLPSFGTFSVAQRKARAGRNPRTGASIQIPARKAAVFKPGRALKEAVK